MEKIYVTKASLPPMDEYLSEIKDIWSSHTLTNMGPKHDDLTSKLKSYLDVDKLQLLSNGHMAIELSIQALNLSGEVITTPFTFASTTHAIVRNGLTPVFCDVRLDDFTIDAGKIESLITERTSAILPVHVYGNICDFDRIGSIAKKHNLKVIYDAAHAFGERVNGENVAKLGDVSCFSFHATKVFNTIEGGAACYHEEEIGNRLYRLKNFGIKNEECVDGIGANAKMNEFCAAMGLCNLKYIDLYIAKRKKVYELYLERLQSVRGIQINAVDENVESNYAYFPIVIHDEFGIDRNELVERFKHVGVYPRKYFYPLTNEFECYAGRFEVDKTPNALYLSRRILTLPIYPELEETDVDRICKVILNK